LITPSDPHVANVSGNLFDISTPPPTTFSVSTMPVAELIVNTPGSPVKSNEVIPIKSGDVYQTTSASLEDSGSTFNLSTPNFSNSPLAIWEQEQITKLQQKAEKEAERHKDLQQKAKASLQKAKEDREEKNSKTKQNNKMAEASNPPTQLKGKDWEKVSQLVDLSEKGKKGERDTSRFKAILIEMKGK